MEEKVIKLALVDNSIFPEVYKPVRHWQNVLPVDFDVFRAPEGRFPDVKEYTHLIITGSEASILERDGWVEQEIEIAKQAAAQGLSILGSCYGHQVLALALAGSQHVRRAPVPEIGWIEIRITSRDDILGHQQHAHVFSSHLDEVVDLPDEFTVLASSKDCRIQAFRWKNRNVWGLQIHPEISVGEAREYLKNRVARGHEPLVLFQKALESVPRDSGLIRNVVKTFCS
ncbi:MAG: type 1 glutamine amidotransferase [Candidatus Aminicenantales bacterium]